MKTPQKLWSIEDLQRDYEYTSSGHFFSKNTMRFFASRLTSNFKQIDSTRYLFITSEKKSFNDCTRVFTLRIAEQVIDSDKFHGYRYSINTVDEYYQLTRSKALTAFKNYKVIQ